MKLKSLYTILLSLVLIACQPKATEVRTLETVPVDVLPTITEIPTLQSLLEYATVVSPRYAEVGVFEVSPESFDVIFHHCYEAVGQADGNCDSTDLPIEGIWMLNSYLVNGSAVEFRSEGISNKSGDLVLQYGESVLLMVPYDFKISLPSGETISVCAKEQGDLSKIDQSKTIQIAWSKEYCPIESIS